jgi:hypothetical protein
MDTNIRRQAIGRLGAAQRKINIDIKKTKLKKKIMLLHESEQAKKRKKAISIQFILKTLHKKYKPAIFGVDDDDDEDDDDEDDDDDDDDGSSGDDDDDDGSSGVCSGETFPMPAHDNITGLFV